MPYGIQNHRSVAQPGSAPYWGCGGRGFKSRRSDQIKRARKTAGFFVFGGLKFLK